MYEMHKYRSTACQHGLHDQCRLVCKFCNAPCNCRHHKENKVTEQTPEPNPVGGQRVDEPGATNPKPDNTPEPEADATANDELAEQTDNSPTELDGDQEAVSQDPVEEDDVADDETQEATDGEPTT